MTWFILSRRNEFKIHLINDKKFKRYSDVYFTVDEPDDLYFLRSLHRYLPDRNRMFGIGDLYAVLDKHRELLTINKDITHNKGLR